MNDLIHFPSLDNLRIRIPFKSILALVGLLLAGMVCMGQTTGGGGSMGLPPLDLGPDIEKCIASIARLDAGPGYTSYTWSNGAHSQIVSTTIAGRYIVTAVDPWAAVHIDTVDVTIAPDPSPAFSVTAGPTSHTFNDLSTNTDYWIWQFEGNASSHNQNPVYSFSAPGVYNVCLHAINDCASKTLCQSITSVYKMAPGDVTTFPNPTNGPVTLELDLTDAAATHINVYNFNGQRLFHFNGADLDSNFLPFDLSGNEAGLYIVEVVQPKGKTVRKIHLMKK